MEDTLIGFGGDFENPNFEQAGKVHDWRNYAGEELRKIWKTLNFEQKKAVAISLENIASYEHWD